MCRFSWLRSLEANTTAIDGPGGHIGYAYDSRARIASVTDHAGGRFTMRYDGADQRIELARPNGVTDTTSYLAGSLESRTASAGAQVLGLAAYALDPLRRRTSLTDLDGTHGFTHDDGDRLTGATHPALSGLAPETFQYDTVGNRLSWSGSPTSAVSYDTAHQLLGDGTYDYSYDSEGRVVERHELATGDTTRYRWSSAGRLTSIEGPGGRSSYRYDAFGRRVEVDDNGTVSRFVYSDWNIHLAYDGSNALAATYVVGDDLGTPLAVHRGSATYYPLEDVAGSATVLTDLSGAVVGHTRFTAFGVPQVSGIGDAALSFAGHQFDATTGLLYARHRYYEPTTGRFLSQDPEPSVNPYPYALDAPLEYTDPTGRDAMAERIVVECDPRKWGKKAMKVAWEKFKAYEKAELKVTKTDALRKAAKPLQRAFRKKNKLGKGLDADHIIELVLGGAIAALQAFDSSANRSFGAQIGNAISSRDLAAGTRVIIVPVNCGKGPPI